MYMMTTFLLTTGLYYFFNYSSSDKSRITDIELQKYKRSSLMMMNLFFGLAFLTFYGSAFLIATIFLYILIKKQYKSFFICIFSAFAYFLVVSPLLYHQLLNSRSALAEVKNWTAVLGKADLKNLLLIPIKFSIGRIDFYPKWLYYGIAGSWTTFVFISTFLFGAEPKKTLLKYLFIFPLVLGFLVSFVTPLLQYFRFIYLIPIMAILLAIQTVGSAQSTPRRWALVLGFATFSFIYLLFPQFHREDWKNLVKSLPQREPVYMVLSSSDPVKYYDDSLKLHNLENLKNADTRQLIVIPYTADIHGIDYRATLAEKRYSLVKEKAFNQLLVEYWKKN